MSSRDSSQKETTKMSQINLNSEEAKVLLSSYEKGKAYLVKGYNQIKKMPWIAKINSKYILYVREPVERLVNKYFPQIQARLRNNIILRFPVTLVNESYDKNDIVVQWRSREFRITYVERKMGVLAFTLMASFLHSCAKKRLFARYLPLYYLASSLFICRENLNPYL